MINDLESTKQDSTKIAGLKPNWHVNFNICMLRLVSFNMDRYWASKGRSPSSSSSNSVSVASYEPFLYPAWLNSICSQNFLHARVHVTEPSFFIPFSSSRARRFLLFQLSLLHPLSPFIPRRTNNNLPILHFPNQASSCDSPSFDTSLCDKVRSVLFDHGISTSLYVRSGY